MAIILKITKNKIVRIRLQFICSLIFLFVLNSCRNENTGQPEIVWHNDKAIAVKIFPSAKQIQGDEFKQIQVKLNGKSEIILGNVKKENGQISFTPLIPFTHGLRYQIFFEEKEIGQFIIPAVGKSSAQEIVAVFPSTDALPANLLKWYISFSRPMQEGEALKHVHLIRNQRDTLTDVFLDLNPELWNKESTVLTIWMDPGRIKRGLQPNLKLGPPMAPGEQYELYIDSLWRDGNGTDLKRSFRKQFVTTNPDTISPVPAKWKLGIPGAETKDPLSILFGESLDQILVQNSLTITAASGKTVEGKFHINSIGDGLRFYPENEWQEGKYFVSIDTKLEDLAGNNLNRLFDQEVSMNVGTAETATIQFAIGR